MNTLKYFLTLVAVFVALNLFVYGQKISSQLIRGYGPINCIDVSPNSTDVLSADANGNLVIWDVTTGYPKSFFDLPKANRYDNTAVTHLQFLPDTMHFVTVDSKNRIMLWNINERAPLSTVTGTKKMAYIPEVLALDVFVDGTMITGHADNTLRRWRVSANGITDEGTPFVGHDWNVNTVAYSRDGKSIYSGGSDGKVISWNTGGYPMRIYNDHLNTVNSLDVRSDNELIVSSSYDNNVIVRRTLDGRIVRNFRIDTTQVNVVRFSPDNNYIAVGTEKGQVVMFNIQTGEYMTVYGDHTKSVTALEITPDGRYLLSGSTDETIFPTYVKDIYIMMQFRKEIQNQLDTAWAFRDKGEFETELEFVQRKGKYYSYRDSLMNFYRSKYTSITSADSASTSSQRTKTLHTVTLKVDSISLYRPEPNEQYFFMKLSVLAPGKKSYESVEGLLYIPREEAKAFKDNYKKAKITAQAYQPSPDGEYKLLKVTIYHPKIKDKTYPFSPQQSTNVMRY